MDVERALKLAKDVAVSEIEARFMELMGAAGQLQMVVDEVLYVIEEERRSRAAPANEES